MRFWIKSWIFFIIFVIALKLNATHNRAGEVTYSHVSGYTYLLKITTYTYTKSPADRSYLEIKITGEGSVIAPRDSQVIIPNSTYFWNTYSAEYTFSGPGTYEIIVEDPNRNLGVKNIPNSVNIPFSIKTYLLVNNDLGSNNAPIMLSPPIHKAALNRIFIHNSVSYDIEGDSLSFGFTKCTGERGIPISTYSLPEASNFFTIDEESGEMVWNTPIDTGIYNVAIEVKEWRDGITIGKITRDMQIEVYKTDNFPPSIDEVSDYCVFANSMIDIIFEVYDYEDDRIECEINGGPLLNNGSIISLDTLQSIPGFARYHFNWIPTCDDVRNEPYDMVITAKDKNKDVPLADARQFTIKVIGPPPIITDAIPFANAINISWEQGYCDNVDYLIYRKSDSTAINYHDCLNGIPVSLGYKEIGEVTSGTESFYDNNNGSGLIQGFKYCYVIVTRHQNGALSYPSEVLCSYLLPPLPNIIQTSVRTINPTNGSVIVKWLKPKGLVEEGFNGPYKYKIYRSENLFGLNRILIDSIATTDLNDTIFIDTLFNTVQYPYSYTVEMYDEEGGNQRLIDDNPGIASTLYADIQPSDNELNLIFKRNVPWINTLYEVFRLNNTNGQFELTGTSTEENYIDSGLVNGREYCYKVTSYGVYVDDDGNEFSTINKSHLTCGIPEDTIPPCPPVLSIETNCDSLSNQLTWLYPSECEQEVLFYKIYYKPVLGADFDSLIRFPNTVHEYLHKPENTNAGCYFVTAIDSFENESDALNVVCVDICLNYELPNVFTPNNDRINDRFIPISVDATIEKVEMQIYNRWGQLVFETEDPYINWNGLEMNSNNLVPTGLYYYICDVYARGVKGLEPYNKVGFIQVYTQENTIIVDE
ncbi:gliding motility-associated C-terminal domain-containing protein [Bacteroidota bacterium]